MSVNRSKRSIAIDLSTPDGRALLDALAERCDVLVENFRPSVAARLGCDAKRMRERFPRLIVCSMSASGHDDPESEAPAFDLTLQARAGTMGITGDPGRMPVRMGPPVGDLAGGLYAALAIAAALVERARTGDGQTIDLSLLDAQASLLVYAAAFHLNAGHVLGPQGSAHAHAIPYQAFVTADRPIVVAVFTDRFWPGFCRALGGPAWSDDARLATHAGRRAHHDVWFADVERSLREKNADVWLAAFAREGVPCAPVQSVDAVCGDPSLVSREMIATMSHPSAGTVRVLGNPMKLGDWRNEPHAPPPRLGEHTDALLHELLDLTDDRIASLRARGVVR
jgi:crotonobetainyl-CoA:carnitine CoA-transferase CaiB-like acyl-CoA transferase